MATESSEQLNEQPDSGAPEKHGWYEGFKLRSIAFAKYLRREISRGERSNQQGDTAPKSLDWLVITAAAIAAAAIIRILMAAGAFEDSNRIIALLTFVLSVVGALQWWTYHRQWQVMRDQHVTMEKQIRLARRSSRQTDKIIGQMKQEQRAWLFTTEVFFVKTRAGTRLEAVARLKNSGTTPAQMISGKSRLYVRSFGDDSQGVVERLIAEFENISPQSRRFVVAPGGIITVLAPGDPTERDAQRIMLGAVDAFVIGSFTYNDIDGVPHEFGFLYSYQPDHDAFAQRHEYSFAT